MNSRGRLQSADDFGNIVVNAGAGDAITLLKDVARVELGSNAYALHALLDNQPAVGLPIKEAPNANALQQKREAFGGGISTNNWGRC